MGGNIANDIFNMDALAIIFSSITLLAISTNAVPPSACLANFRWEDCGREPEPKMYYWKPGSRCEVGIWRGCLPSLNMFKDEYECVSTCIFSVRAQPIDYHNKQALVAEDEEKDSSEEMTTGNDTDNTDMTTSSYTTDADGNSTVDLDVDTTVDVQTTLSADNTDVDAAGTTTGDLEAATTEAVTQE